MSVVFVIIIGNGGIGMIEYKKYGFGKVGYVENKYTITDDYKINLSVKISGEIGKESFSINNIPLTEEEIAFIKLIEDHFNSKKKKVSIFEDEEKKYEGEELIFNGNKIEDDEQIKFINYLLLIIGEEHKELNSRRVANMYERMSKKTYEKNKKKL